MASSRLDAGTAITPPGWEPEHPYYQQMIMSPDHDAFDKAFADLAHCMEFSELAGGSDDGRQGTGAAAPPDR